MLHTLPQKQKNKTRSSTLLATAGSTNAAELILAKLGTAPLHVVGENLGLQCMDGTWGLDQRQEDVAVHVAAIIA